MFPKRKVTRNRRPDEDTPSRRARLSARSAALIVLGSGMVGLSAAPMAHAAGHDSLKTFRSSSTFTAPEHGAHDTDDDAAADDRAGFKDDTDDDAAVDDRAGFKDDTDDDAAADDRAGFKDDTDDDAAADDRAEFKDGADDRMDFVDDDGLRITVIVNNNNNNAAGNNNNNNNNVGGRTNTNNNNNG
ncbi:hypothetical protein SRB17_06610 [Streptomyces sp. RB17]|uniref:hypothetical protein n=1 Tax=Streptomyces sp. RB17 TaxID=2585197 RepID=UPI001294CED7|nr:hypothetical protein [Streptomyces sp. RB17]MQY32707.1 hypothetical protein [Streptomyces sp. RB17]